jgi:hypothetical protein
VIVLFLFSNVKGQYEALAMPVETLGEACSQGWRVTVRCADGRTESPRSQSSRECSYRRELDIETLVWTRGRAFPRRRDRRMPATMSRAMRSPHRAVNKLTKRNPGAPGLVSDKLLSRLSSSRMTRFQYPQLFSRPLAPKG